MDSALDFESEGCRFEPYQNQFLGLVAQLAAQWIPNPEIAGSSPVKATSEGPVA